MRSETTFDHYHELSPEDRLKVLHNKWSEARSGNEEDQTQVSFWAGRMLEVTIDMEEHPDWYEHGCACLECRSL